MKYEEDEVKGLLYYIGLAIPKIIILTNGFFTGLFGYMFLDELLPFAWVPQSVNSMFGAIVALVLFDVSYFGWKAISLKSGLSTDQFNIAKYMSTYGVINSSLASVVSAVLFTNLIVLNDMLQVTFETGGLVMIVLSLILSFLGIVAFDKLSPENKLQESKVQLNAKRLDMKIQQSNRINQIARQASKEWVTDKAHVIGTQHAQLMYLQDMKELGFKGTVMGEDGIEYSIGAEILPLTDPPIDVSNSIEQSDPIERFDPIVQLNADGNDSVPIIDNTNKKPSRKCRGCEKLIPAKGNTRYCPDCKK